MNTINNLVLRRMVYDKSRSILTMITLLLTTTLLATVAFSGLGVVQVSRQNAAANYGNHHVTFNGLDEEQIEALQSRQDIEALSTQEVVASVVAGKMNAYLKNDRDFWGEISAVSLTAGRQPQARDEIAGPPAFFERLGEEAVLGNKITLDLRLYGEGEIISRDFTIVGLQEQVDLSQLDIADTRIVYSAAVSEAFCQEELDGIEREYRAKVRLIGEDELTYAEMRTKVEAIAAELGLEEQAVALNQGYLRWTLEPAWETLAAVVGIGALVVLFSVLVIYSIYYVSSITNVQELGKLKALGATKRQMRQLFWREGLLLALPALPIGILLGWALSFAVLRYMSALGDQQPPAFGQLWSSWAAAVVAVAVVLTIFLALAGPMRVAGRISPMEAIGYQSAETQRLARRKGHKMMTVAKLSYANLARHGKRTAVTMVTMGLSCVLFMAVAGLLSSISLEDLARRQLAYGDFELSLYYSTSDEAYPENELNHLQLQDYLGQPLQEQILALEGVQSVRTADVALVEVNEDTFAYGDDNKRTTVGTFDRESFEQIRDKLAIKLTYDEIVSQKGIIFGYGEESFARNGFVPGQTIALTFLDGTQQVPAQLQLLTSGVIGTETFLLPQPLFDHYMRQSNAAGSLYIAVDEQHYDAIKGELQLICDSNPYFRLKSYDEEYAIAQMSVQMVKYPAYAFLAIIGVISFMNLINTMITSIITRRRELGILQAIGMSDCQLRQMLRREGAVFTAGAIALALSLGNILGYLAYRWGKENGFMGIEVYHYPLGETVLMIALISLAQLAVTAVIGKYIQRETLVERIR